MNTSSTPPRLTVIGLQVGGSAGYDVTVTAGELVAITGEGGTELFRAITGVLAHHGKVLFDGRPVADPLHDHQLGVVLIPRGNGLAQLLTAAENILLPLMTRPGTTDAQTTVRHALAAVGLEDSADHLIEELSGGQQQRVAVARALALRPRLLIADQATTDLDPANRVRVIALFRELAASGAAVVLASDDPAVAMSCDRTIQIDGAARSEPSGT